MNEKDFADLLESIKQAGEIKQGRREPSRHLPIPATAIQQSSLATATFRH
jgi:hypothetical protein